MKFLLPLLINGLFIFVAARFLPGVFVESYLAAIITGLVLGLVNLIIKPIITLLTLPITIVTFGIFLLFINGGMVLLVDWLIPGFGVEGIGSAILFSLVLAFLNLLIGNSTYIKE